jgi:hypothetical protein
MLKLSVKQTKILNLLLTAKPKIVATKLNLPIQHIYDAKYKLKTDIQNAEEYLQVTQTKYAALLKNRKLKTPQILNQQEDSNDNDELEFTKHQQLQQQKQRRRK